MSEQTNKFFIDASFNHLIEVKNNGDALLTIHNDGTITAAEVLRIMRETWMDDAQSIKIRDQQERIKRLEEAGDALCAAAAFMGWHMEIEKWRKAKEAKP